MGIVEIAKNLYHGLCSMYAGKGAQPEKPKYDAVYIEKLLDPIKTVSLDSYMKEHYGDIWGRLYNEEPYHIYVEKPMEPDLVQRLDITDLPKKPETNK